MFDAAEAGTQLGSTLTQSAAAVEDGLFSAALDFGAQYFDGRRLWLELAARDAGTTETYELLTPRNELTPGPYALFAAAADFATSSAFSSATAPHEHPFSQVTGQISDAQVPDNITIDSAASAGHAASADLATTASVIRWSGVADKPSSYTAAPHGHPFSQVAGQISDAQVPNNITIDYAASAGTAASANESTTATYSLQAANAALLDSLDSTAFGRLAQTNEWTAENAFANGVNSLRLQASGSLIHVAAAAPGAVNSVDYDNEPSNYWSDPGEAIEQDNIGAGCVPGTFTDYLHAYNFGFQIPSGAVILGIEVLVRKRCEVYEAPAVSDYSVRLFKNNEPIAIDKAAAYQDWLLDTWEDSLYGGEDDLWVETWTAADVNSSDFGVGFSAYGDFCGNCPTQVDAITIYIYYQMDENLHFTFGVDAANPAQPALSLGIKPESQSQQEWARVDREGNIAFMGNVSIGSYHIDANGLTANNKISGAASADKSTKLDSQWDYDVKPGDYGYGVYAGLGTLGNYDYQYEPKADWMLFQTSSSSYGCANMLSIKKGNDTSDSNFEIRCYKQTTGSSSAFSTYKNVVLRHAGTSNYLPKWNSTQGQLANSIVYDDGTNAGIGTSSPRSKLEVNGIVTVDDISPTPTSAPSNSAQFFASGGEMFVLDSTGHQSQLSSHCNPAQLEEGAQSSFTDLSIALPWSFHHANALIGKEAVVDMARVADYVERKIAQEKGPAAEPIIRYRDIPKEQRMTLEQFEQGAIEDQIRRLLKADPWVEIPLNPGDALPVEAWEQVEIFETRQETETVRERRIDWQTASVVEVEVEKPVEQRVATGRFERRLREGFDFRDGQLLRRRTVQDINSDQLTLPELPKWILDRMPKDSADAQSGAAAGKAGEAGEAGEAGATSADAPTTASSIPSAEPTPAPTDGQGAALQSREARAQRLAAILNQLKQKNQSLSQAPASLPSREPLSLAPASRQSLPRAQAPAPPNDQPGGSDENK